LYKYHFLKSPYTWTTLDDIHPFDTHTQLWHVAITLKEEMREVMMWCEITKIPLTYRGVHDMCIKNGVYLSFFFLKIEGDPVQKIGDHKQQRWKRGNS